MGAHGAQARRAARVTGMDDLTYDGLLRLMTDGLPPVPKHLQLHCHPDVHLALRALSDKQQADEGWPPPPAPVPVYGTADIIVKPEMGSGCWELLEDGEVIKSGWLEPLT